MKKYIVEFIGTFFLVLTIVLTVNGNAGVMAPLAIGGILMVMVFAGRHISGAHFNPAVTFAIWIRGECKASDIPGYMTGQVLGGVLASFVAKYLLDFIPGAAGITTGGGFDIIGGTLAEFLGTFALVWVVLNVATAKSTEGNSFYGIAIGFTIMACAYALGGVTGGAFNPAVAMGISVIGMTAWSNFAAFLIGQFAAGATAAFTFKFINGTD
ncbi:MAG: aquaporin [Bacteroidetes bacterium]|nr:aquaporin [Bacteroidota bacterium]